MSNEVGLHGIAETEGVELRVRRCGRIFAAMVFLDLAATVIADLIWPRAVLPLIVGFCLAWLTVVALFMFQEARGAR